MLVWTNFDSFAITYLSSFKNFIFQQRLCLILWKQKKPETSFQTTVLVEFFWQNYSLWNMTTGQIYLLGYRIQ